MSLKDQFEKMKYERPAEPYSIDRYPDQWIEVMQWDQSYIAWLESCIETEREKNRQLSELLKEKQ